MTEQIVYETPGTETPKSGTPEFARLESERLITMSERLGGVPKGVYKFNSDAIKDVCRKEHQIALQISYRWNACVCTRPQHIHLPCTVVDQPFPGPKSNPTLSATLSAISSNAFAL